MNGSPDFSPGDLRRGTIVPVPFIYDDVTVRTHRGRPPHWDVSGGLYLLTFRQLDALPLRIYREIEKRRNLAVATAERLADAEHRDAKIAAARSQFQREVEDVLDEGHGSCVFANKDAADVAHRKMLSFDGDLFRHVAHSIMPNHVHAVVRLLAFDLAETLKRVKGGISIDVNRAIGRRGSLWQEGYFDTLVRDEAHLRVCTRYTIENPAKAGLREWEWTHFSAEGWRSVLGM